MNAYGAAKKMYSISEELTFLSQEFGKTSELDARKQIEQKINILEVEFFQLKHAMKKKEL